VVLVSDFTPGWRLSDMLAESTAASVPIDVTIVIAVLRQLLPSVALFSRHNRDAAIGVLAPHRLILTPNARLAIAEYAFGPAMEKLNLGREKLWRDFRVTMPPSTGLPRANPRADVMSIGVVALSMLIGRPLELDEFPDQLDALLEGAQESRDGKASPIAKPLKNWLRRAMQIEPDRAFRSPSESQLSFESVLASDKSYVAATALNSWVSEIGGTLDIKHHGAPPPAEPSTTAATPAPASAPEIEIDLDQLVVQSASALAQEKREQEAQAEAKAAEEEAVAETPAEPEREAEPEPPVPVQAQEEDPIVAQLRTYQPKYDTPVSAGGDKGDPPRVAAKVEEEDPIAAQLRTYQPKIEPKVEEEDPIVAQLRTYQPK
jgi:hypothetical protein